jgi:hypothetical protein
MMEQMTRHTQADGYRTSGKWVATLVAIAGALALGVLVSQAAAGAGKVRWFQATLEQGETNGYRWAVGVKGPKDQSLGSVCAQLSMVEPPQNDVPYVEGGSSTVCGRLKRPNDSVSGTESLGLGESRVTVLEVVYRPVVRKVTLVLATDAREVFYPRIPEIPHRAARGIPIFRYFVAPFEGETCIRRIATFDGDGSVVSNEVRPPCPPGAGNL